MKKGKIFGKRQIITAALVLCLAAAVWFNMQYSSFDLSTGGNESKGDLKDTQFLSSDNTLGEAVQTGGGVSYINDAKNERNSKRTTALEEFKEIINNSSLDEAAKLVALKGIAQIGENINDELAIETVIKAKGFNDALVIISEETITVLVAKDSLLTSETLQIQDAVLSQKKVDLEKIKIIAVK